MPSVWQLFCILWHQKERESYVMRTLIDYAEKIVLRLEQWPEKAKYKLLVSLCTAVHFLLIFLFLYMKIFPMVIFNCFSVASYICCIFLLKLESYFQIFLITYFEIILHSFVATIFTGWSFGFPLYIFVLIPLSYYICYTINADFRKLFIATLLGIFAFVSFIACRILSSLITPSYQTESKVFQFAIYIFNTVCAFTLLIGFSLIFLLGIQYLTRQLERQNTQLEELANIDPLTGLYNRRCMHKFLSAAMESGARFSLIMCDIDNFKKLNDTYGHEFGDIVLKEVSEIIKTQTSEDDCVCRWGGEEILILCSNTSAEQVRQTAEAIRCNVAEKNFKYKNSLVHCTLTLGLAEHKSKQKIETTISEADMKLYQGKQNGKNVVVA